MEYLVWSFIVLGIFHKGSSADWYDETWGWKSWLGKDGLFSFG